MSIPALVPGLAHSGSFTFLSTSREARVLSQSTPCEVKKRERRKDQSQLRGMSLNIYSGATGGGGSQTVCSISISTLEQKHIPLQL